jgi:ATP-dependent RNA helicase SUPV3L1/SUV3
LQRGDAVLTPNIVLLRNERLDATSRNAVIGRLERWFDGHLRHRLRALFQARDADLSAAARGIVFQLAEGLGAVARSDARAQIAALDSADRTKLSRLGLRFGTHALYLAPLLRPSAQRLRAVLAAVHTGLPAPRSGRAPSISAAEGPLELWPYIGYRVLGDRAIRLDSAEKLAAVARKRARKGPFTAASDLVALAGCDGAEFAAVLRDLGYRIEETEAGAVFRQKKKRTGGNRRAPRAEHHASTAREESPFAKLRDLASAK